MNLRSSPILVLACTSALLTTACDVTQVGQNTADFIASPSDHSEIHQILDQWHKDASTGNTESYFDAMTQGAVFLGTDASERWQRDEFRTFAEPHFADGHGWTYHPRDRHIKTNATGDTAWIDEILDHDSYGTLRGTAVLRLNGEEWRIAHYSLTFLIPNDTATDVVSLIERNETHDKGSGD